MPGRNPEGFNPDLPETQASQQASQSEVEVAVDVKPEQKPLQADDFATGDDSEYERPSVGVPQKGFEEKFAGRSAIGGGKKVEDGVKINARKGLGSGLRSGGLPTTHGVRAEGAAKYGRREEEAQTEKKDKNKLAIQEVLAGFELKSSFRLEVSKDDRTKYFLQVFEEKQGEKKQPIFRRTGIIEDLSRQLEGHLGHNYARKS